MNFASGRPNPNTNLIINGNCLVDQRRGFQPVTIGTLVSSDWIADRFLAYARALAQNISANIQTYQSGSPYSNVLRFQVNTATLPIDPTDYTGIQYCIEGFDFSPALFSQPTARPITVSFAVFSNVAGTYGLSFANNANTRYFMSSYTINAANTWERKSVTIPGDTIGTWDITNARGIRIWFDLGCGAGNCRALSPVWQANGGGLAAGLIGGQSIWGAANNVIHFGDIAVKLAGSNIITPSEIYAQTIVKCKRYYQKLFGAYVWQTFGAGMVSAGAAVSYVALPGLIPMRTTPTVRQSNCFLSSGAAGNSITSIAVDGPDNRAGYNVTVGHSGGGFAVGAGCVIEANNNSNAFIELEAEL